MTDSPPPRDPWSTPDDPAGPAPGVPLWPASPAPAHPDPAPPVESQTPLPPHLTPPTPMPPTVALPPTPPMAPAPNPLTPAPPAWPASPPPASASPTEPATPPPGSPAGPAGPPPASAPAATPVAYPGSPAAWSPGPVPGAPTDPVVARIGELAVTSSTVHTPAGQIPLRGSTWLVSDQWLAEQKTPAWAIVAAILGFCVLTVFSLLFLLVKETVYRGMVQVTVTNSARQYVARIPVANQAEVAHLHQQVNYARSLAAL